MTDVVVNIAGRDALFVWTIPYVTSRRPTPDELLLRLVDADYDFDCGNTFPTAFTLDSHGDPVPIPRSWWVKKLNRIEKLDQRMDDDEWDKRTIEVLMEDEVCFIWFDEFKQWFDVYRKYCHHPIPGKFQPETLFDLEVIGTLHPEIFPNTPLSAEHQQYFESQKLKTLPCKARLETVSQTKNKGENYNFRDDPDLTKLEKQQLAILEGCKKKDYPPLAIPDRGKGSLKAICETDYPELFDGSSSFDNAWKQSKSLVRMANHASYAKRGIN